MKSMIKNTLILTAITLVAGVLLGFVYEITKEPIAMAQETAKKEAYQNVMSDADTFDVMTLEEYQNVEGTSVDEAVEAKEEDTLKGYIITATSKNGYGGDIQIVVGVSLEGMVTGVEILSISETAGLGMNAQKEEFREQYVGKSIDAHGYKVTKSDAAAENEIDAISGATVTSNAVTDAVNVALSYYYNVIGGGANE